MKYYLYPNGKTKNTSLFNAEFLLKLIFVSLLYWGWVVMFRAVSDWLYEEEPLANTAFFYLYTLPPLPFLLYILIKSRLPMVRIDKDTFVTYRGLIMRDKVPIADIKTIETELNDDSGIQLIIYKKSGGKYTAEIPYNSCSDADFVKFIQEHRPELEVITHTQLIRKSYKLEAIENKALTTTFTQNDDELWSLMQKETENGNTKEVLKILMELKERGHPCEGLIGYILYTDGNSEFNKHKALPFLLQGEQYKCDLSLMCLGAMHLRQELKNSSPEQGYDYLARATGARDPLCFHHLGYCYLEGLGTDINLKKAKYNFLKAIALGDRGAYVGLARIEGLKRNRCAVFRLVLKAQKEAPLK